jgi:hypothetical protein
MRQSVSTTGPRADGLLGETMGDRLWRSFHARPVLSCSRVEINGIQEEARAVLASRAKEGEGLGLASWRQEQPKESSARSELTGRGERICWEGPELWSLAGKTIPPIRVAPARSTRRDPGLYGIGWRRMLRLFGSQEAPPRSVQRESSPACVPPCPSGNPARGIAHRSRPLARLNALERIHGCSQARESIGVGTGPLRAR